MGGCGGGSPLLLALLHPARAGLPPPPAGQLSAGAQRPAALTCHPHRTPPPQTPSHPQLVDLIKAYCHGEFSEEVRRQLRGCRQEGRRPVEGSAAVLHTCLGQDARAAPPCVTFAVCLPHMQRNPRRWSRATLCWCTSCWTRCWTTGTRRCGTAAQMWGRHLTKWAHEVVDVRRARWRAGGGRPPCLPSSSARAAWSLGPIPADLQPAASPGRAHHTPLQVTDPAVLKSLIFQKGWVTPSTKKKREAEAANATLQVRGCRAGGRGLRVGARRDAPASAVARRPPARTASTAALGCPRPARSRARWAGARRGCATSATRSSWTSSRRCPCS